MRIIFLGAFAVVALVGLVVVMQPAWLCGVTGIGCEGGFARDCLRASGATTEYTPGVSPSGDSFSAHLGGKEVIVGAKDPEQIGLILACVEKAYERKLVRDDYVTTTAIQLGLVEEQWTDGELSLDILEPAEGTARDHLMNLAFGPAGGKRKELMEQWCSQNEKCVTCQSAPGERSYVVSIKPDAKFTKAYNGTAPLAGNRRRPYQLVEPDKDLEDGIGRRVIFLCSA